MQMGKTLILCFFLKHSFFDQFPTLSGHNETVTEKWTDSVDATLQIRMEPKQRERTETELILECDKKCMVKMHIQ